MDGVVKWVERERGKRVRGRVDCIKAQGEEGRRATRSAASTTAQQHYIKCCSI